MSSTQTLVGGRLRSGLSIVVLLTLGMRIAQSLSSQQVAAHAPAEDARNTEITTTDTHLPLPAFTSLQSWELRKAFLRNQILVSAGLSPMPVKTPLHAQIFGKIE